MVFRTLWSMMRRLFRRRGGALTLDHSTAARLLNKSLAAEDAPPAYAAVAEVLRAAAAPAGPAELAGEWRAVGAFNTEPRGGALRALPRHARARRLVPALGIAAALGIGGGAAAAATGNLPDAAQDAVHNVLDKVGIDVPEGAESGHGHADGASQNGQNAGSTNGHGPNLSGPAKVGLCKAYFSGQGGEHGKKNDSSAFKALEKAAGGADKIAAFCADAIPGGGAPNPTDDAGAPPPENPPTPPATSGKGTSSPGAPAGGGPAGTLPPQLPGTPTLPPGPPLPPPPTLPAASVPDPCQHGQGRNDTKPPPPRGPPPCVPGLSDLPSLLPQ